MLFIVTRNLFRKSCLACRRLTLLGHMVQIGTNEILMRPQCS